MGSPWNHIAIGFEYPLSHLITFTKCRSKHPAKHLPIKWEPVLVFSIIAPFIELITAYIRDVTFLMMGRSVWGSAMKFEKVFGREVVDPCCPLNAVVPKCKRAIGLLHVLADGLFNEANVEFCLVGPRCSFFKGT